MAAALVVAAGALAGQANARSVVTGGKASYPPKHATLKHFKHPKLTDGLLTIIGTKASDTIALRLQERNPGVLQVDVGGDGSADFSFDRNKIAAIAVDAREGDDIVRIDETNGAFTDGIPTTIDGGPGNDAIAGGKGIETLIGGDGNDSIDGNGGNDVEFLGAGDDVSVWDPGDGSDTVEGQDGTDTLLFNGAGGADTVDISANGNRLKFFRNPGNITMDTAGVERVVFNALGGADVVTINDLGGTDVDSVNVDLAGSLAVTTGDGQADHVVVNATNGNDAIDVSGDTSEVKVGGLAATIRVLHSDGPNDRLDVNTLAGIDTLTTAGLAAGSIQLFFDGVLIP